MKYCVIKDSAGEIVQKIAYDDDAQIAIPADHSKVDIATHNLLAAAQVKVDPQKELERKIKQKMRDMAVAELQKNNELTNDEKAIVENPSLFAKILNFFNPFA